MHTKVLHFNSLFCQIEQLYSHSVLVNIIHLCACNFSSQILLKNTKHGCTSSVMQCSLHIYILKK